MGTVTTGAPADGGPSQHPVDQLIRHLVYAQTAATEEQIQAILERMATAPFSTKASRVPLALRVPYLGRTLGRRADSLSLHVVKRVLDEQQWRAGTTEADYLSDIRSAVRSPSARLLVYDPGWGGAFAAVIARTMDVVRPTRLGETAEEWIVVIYSADDATIRTAYMFSRLSKLRLPEAVVWLR